MPSMRPTFLSSRLVRCFSSSPVQPVSSGSWGWDSASIERRVGSMRKPAPLDANGVPLGRTGLTRGQPSEEDVYFAAGAPGYDALPAAAPEAAAAASKPAPDMEAAAATSAAAPAAAAAAASLGQVVRLSRGVVPQKNLTSLLSTWRLVALPVYRGLPGCLGARLLLGESESVQERSTQDAGPRGGLKTVMVVTEWRAMGDLQGAESLAGQEGQQGRAYSAAVKQLAAHFRGEVNVATFGQEEQYAYVAKGAV